MALSFSGLLPGRSGMMCTSTLEVKKESTLDKKKKNTAARDIKHGVHVYLRERARSRERESEREKERERERERARERARERERDREIEIERERDRQRDKEREREAGAPVHAYAHTHTRTHTHTYTHMRTSSNKSEAVGSKYDFLGGNVPPVACDARSPCRALARVLLHRLRVAVLPVSLSSLFSSHAHALSLAL